MLSSRALSVLILGSMHSANFQVFHPKVTDLLLGRHDLHLLPLAMQIVKPQRAESTDIVHATSETFSDARKPLAGLDLAFRPILLYITGDRDRDLELVWIRIR